MKSARRQPDGLRLSPSNNLGESTIMSLASNGKARTSAGPHVRIDTGGLDDTPAGYTDRDALRDHLGREVIHGSIGRDFSKAYYLDADGNRRPRLYRVDSKAFTRCQYAMLTSPQYAAVLVIDIDQIGTAGGHPVNLAPKVRSVFAALIARNIGPAWVGINPLSGKSQAIWLIDPVYANKSGISRHMSLLTATIHVLGELLGHDPYFAHRFSRSPFYEGKDPTAYRWYCQHRRVIRLGDFIKQVREMSDQVQHGTVRQQFHSGRDLINAVKARREEAQAFKALARDVEADIGAELDQYDPELVDGVRVLWVRQGCAARDETAFRHALKVGHRLRASGKRLTDAALIDAYEYGYMIAQRVGGDGRELDMPPMRDRQTMARRVRGYVVNAKTVPGAAVPATRVTSRERKALATLGRRGGQKAAQRWKTDPEGDYAQGRRKTLEKTHKRRKIQGLNNRQKVGQFVTSFWIETDRLPSWKEIQAETGLSRATVARHIASLKKSGEWPTT